MLYMRKKTVLTNPAHVNISVGVQLNTPKTKK